ncbi:WD-40 repeat protein [Nostoc sp. NIES-3756]|uniref:nSTAND1 domain-containing NTPase n=1 Tax=Nostoc sp. NIES-3756 TaxID=1751286 RepID=UPI00071ED5B9|nr:caspase family protein [Nostoc sp. NIES-3756]BAT54421.1 WD-40 repeat protein [Nostoc sp. NIES-3756]
MNKFTHNLAIAIGINQYQNGIAKLNTAKPDAETLADILRDDYQYQVELITDAEDTERKPTRNELENLLTKWLPKQLQQPAQNNRLLFYFAGHGMALESDDGPRGFLLPQDANPKNPETFLSMQVLHDALIALPCHHLIVILDCCFAGTFRWSSTRKLIPIPETIRREHYDRFIRYPAWQVITSAAHNQEALDFLSDKRGISQKSQGKKHSPFAEALFEALQDGEPDEKGRRYKKADLTKDGVITAPELYLYLRDNVETRSGERQTPGLYPLKKHDRGEYIFHDPNFDPLSLSEADPIDETNNPYRGLKPFEEEHARFFFGRQELIESLYVRIAALDNLLTVILGVSGSGKSSLVKAGLIPYLRELSKPNNDLNQWYILNPIRPGELPFTALARTIWAIADLPTTVELDSLGFLSERLSQEIKQLQPKIAEASRKYGETSRTTQRLKLEAEKFTQITTTWKQDSDTAKQLLIVEYFETLYALCATETEPESQQQWQLKQIFLACLNLLTVRLQSAPNSFVEIVKAWSQKHPGVKLLLVIDQFEELITLGRKAQPNQPSDVSEEWQQFLQLLETTLAANLPQLRILVTLRSDFEPRFLNSEALKSYWTKARFPVRAMRSDELREAIAAPASEMALYFEPANLVDRLIDEVGQMPGSLALLSFTLSEIYIKLHERWTKDSATDRALQIKDYEKLGGVLGALTSRANQEYDNFVNKGEAYKATMRRVMLRMVAIDGGGVARRRALEYELDYPDPEENKCVKEVIERFVNVRLLVKGREDKTSYVEPAHDLLIQGWGLLQEWIESKDEKENLVLQSRLAAPMFDWNSQGCTENSPLLWNQDIGRIERLKEIVDSDNCWLNKLEMHFFKASVKEHDRQARERLEKELELYIELSQRLFTGNDRLDAIAKMIEAGELLHKNKLKISKYKELNFMLIFNHFLNESREINSINIGEQVNNFSFNQDAQVIATVSGENNEKICLVDSQGKQINFEENKEGICDLAFSPDGETLVFGRRDGLVQFYTKEFNGRYALNNIQDNTKKHMSSAYCVNFSPDGNILVSAGIDRKIVFWDRRSFISTTLTKHQSPVKQVIFNPKHKLIAFTQFSLDNAKNEAINIMEYQVSPNGTYQACPRDFQSFNWLRMLKDSSKSKLCGLNPRRLISWKAPDDRYRPIYPYMTEGVQAIDFHPNGEILVAGGLKGELQIWFINKNEKHKILKYVLDDKVESISDVAFSPDGQIVASSHANGIINLWDTSEITNSSYSELQKLQSLAGHKKNITKISFTLDSKRPQLLSSSHDGTVKFWSFRDGFRAYKGDKVRKVSFSANNQIVTTVDKTGKIKLWKANGKPLDNEVIKEVAIVGEVVVNWYSLNETIVSGSIQKPIDRPLTLNFSPNEGIFVIANEDNTIGIWELNRDTKKVKLLKTLKEQPEKITAITFSIDGKVFALGSNDADGEVKLWKLDANQDVQAISTIPNVGGSIVQMSLSNDGEMIGVVINSKTEEYKIKLYRRLNDNFIDCWCSVPTRKITALRFYDENKIIVSIDEAGYVKIWSLKLLENETLKEQQPKFEHALEKIVEAAVFSLNGEKIAMATRLNERDDSYRRIQTLNLNLDSLIKTAMERHPNYLGQNMVSIISD